MKDRIPTYPGRVHLDPVAGQENTFDMTMADEATETGTPLNKANLLKDVTASLFGLGALAVPDDALDRIGHSMAGFNIIDNSWFTVNQRGQNEYIGAKYGFDRWRTWASNADIKKGTNGGVLAGGSMYQYLSSEMRNYLVGKTVTMSVLFDNGQLVSGTKTLDRTGWIGVAVNANNVLALEFVVSSLTPSAYDDLYFRIRCNEGGTPSVAVKAVKVEIGSVSTLANDAVPNYSFELLRCCCSTADASDKFANIHTVGDTRIEVGSYVGTGTAGPSNPNSITFGFTPKLVVFPYNPDWGYVSNYLGASDLLIRYGVSTQFNLDSNSMYASTISYSGTKMSWNTVASGEENARRQRNTAGQTYQYLAIG